MEKYITEKTEVIKDEGKISTFTLHLNKYLTRQLETFRDYLKNHTNEEIKIHSQEYGVKTLLSTHTEGFEKRDILTLRETFSGWNKEDLLDDLYELEYRRFMDFKDDKLLSNIYHDIIFPFLRQNSETGNRDNYTLAFGELGSVIDARTFSLLRLKIIEDKIDKFSLDSTDIFYFKSDRVDGVSRVITPHTPVEVKKGWLPELIEELIGDDDCPLSRERRRSLKYHRSRIFIKDLNFKGEPIDFRRKDHTTALMLIAAELFQNMMSNKGNKYFIEVIPPNRNAFGAINTAIWEFYYTTMTKVPAYINKKIEVEYPVGTLGVYTVGDLVEVLRGYQSTFGDMQERFKGNIVEHPVDHRVMDYVSFCKAKVEDLDLVSEEMKLRLSFREGGKAFTETEIVKVPFYDIYRETEQSRTGVKIFLPQTIYNMQKAFIPCNTSWDFIHPKSSSGIVFGKEMLEGSLPIHWEDC